MSDDLVARLRKTPCCCRCPVTDGHGPGCRHVEAADEIERLRADITRRYRQTIDQAMTEMVDERAKLAEEALGDLSVKLDKMRIERDKLISERGEWADSLAAVAGARDDARSERDKLAADMLEAAGWKAEAKGWRELQTVWKAREDALAARVAALEVQILEAEAIATRRTCSCDHDTGAGHEPCCPIDIALEIRALRLAAPAEKGE